MDRREQLLTEFDLSYADFRSVVEDVSEADFEKIWLDGRWRVREITAHLTGWLGQFAAGMERMSKGDKPSNDPMPWTEVDTWNDTFASHAKGKQKAQIMRELELATEAFKTAAAKLPADRFGDGKTANRMFDLGGISHFREHAEMIRNWRAQESA